MKVINQSWKKGFTTSNKRIVGVAKFVYIGAPYWTGRGQYGWMDIIIFRSFVILISPLLGFVAAVRHSRILIKKQDFSVAAQIFKFNIKILKIFFFVVLFLLLSNLFNSIFFFKNSADSSKRILDSFTPLWLLIMFATTSCGAGVGYLFYVRKNYRFIWLAISFVLVIPALVVFLYVLILEAFPSLRKYAPQDGVGKGAL